MVGYIKMFEQLMPTAQIDTNQLVKVATIIQKRFRGFLDRRIAKAKKNSKEMTEMNELAQKLMGASFDGNEEP